MTQPRVSGEGPLAPAIRTGRVLPGTHATPEPLRVALALAAAGVPVLPLRAGKVPFGNCRTCAGTPPRCGGRPNMKTPGPCRCPAPCHAWAAATTDPHVLTSPVWAPVWREAVTVAYHPGGAQLTVVDLDDAAAVAWARATLPATRVVSTTRGEHWVYRGAMPSSNAVRPGVDVKSLMQYARWLGSGTGRMTVLPAAVRALLVKEDTTPAPGQVASSLPTRTPWDRSVATGCRHTERYVRTGLERGLALVRARTESGAGSQAFGVARFLAAQHTACPGPCGLAALGDAVVAAAVAVGVPEPYARRAVANGLEATSGRAA
ncbi:bifunctional DNA primase/polymerase [Streptomyces scabiei]|uniref:bifunctional DNA primase/polymerase n=1 Tax=Streptomyces scabiei TaxID=1930 RepID=UPI000A587DE2|nr:bifunctional DNA primase/polymerase [Streptomyces scabiei]MDX2834817.1 DNA primase [Streptomyces scabiei]MDX3675430.1 DNA primase [Streptomyces scabiei]